MFSSVLLYYVMKTETITCHVREKGSKKNCRLNNEFISLYKTQHDGF